MAYSMAAETQSASASRSPAYRAVWRWHFYAGLIVAPILMLLALTGALYLFDQEFDAWWYRDQIAVTAEGRPLPLAEQERRVLAAVPSGEVRRVTLPQTDGEASRWLLRTSAGQSREYFLDPYKGRVTGSADPERAPMAVVRKIHGTLLGGEVGSLIVELVACWTLVMLATGLYLWWPRRWKAKGVFIPRLSAQGRRFWRDLHAIPSAFNAILVIFLVMTGLPWSAFWGQQYARLGHYVPFVAPSPNFSAHLPDHQAAAEKHAAHDPAEAPLPWPIQHSPQPMAHAVVHHAALPAGIAGVEPHLPLLDRARHGGTARIFYPDGETGTYMVSYIPSQVQGQRTLHVDPAEGRLIANIGWEDYSPAAKATEWGVMTHMGRQYGLPNQLAGLAVCLGIIGSVAAGLILWWRRRPDGGIGAPESRGETMPRGLLILIAILALLFPLVGASLVLVGAVEWVCRRVKGRQV